MTNGPYVHFEVEADGQTRPKWGQPRRGANIAVQAIALSTEEFGEIRRASLMIGRIGGDQETIHTLGENVGYERKFTARFAAERLLLPARRMRDGARIGDDESDLDRRAGKLTGELHRIPPACPPRQRLHRRAGRLRRGAVWAAGGGLEWTYGRAWSTLAAALATALTLSAGTP